MSLVFLAGKRTPFGANGGSLKDVTPTDLAVHSSKAALAQSGISADEIQHIIFGNVMHTSHDSIYMPRHVGLKTGVPIEVPALGVNRLCGSGFEAVVNAHQQMVAGDAEYALVGGVENMSMAPYVLRGARFGLKMGNTPIVDSLLEGLTDAYVQMPMAITAENLAEKYGFSRLQVDEFALKSQLKTKAATEAKKFDEEIAPWELVDRKGAKTLLSRDEHPRFETTMESLGKLKPVFKKEGVVTAGNASGIVDGAASMIVATEAAAAKKGLKPIGRLVAYGISGCDPKIMGIGPVMASKIALKKASLSMGQMDLVEINEAFAAQAMAVQRELDISDSVFNVNGGAVSIGHPLAASGTRILMTLLYELKRRGKRYGLGSACIGGGQGIALIIERF